MSSVYPTCKKLVVIQGYDNGFLAGPFQLSFVIENEITATVTQCGKRTIELLSQNPISCDVLYSEFQDFEKLLMLFDGKFYPIEDISLEEFESTDTEMCDYSMQFLENRLEYYSSKDFCQYGFTKIIDFQEELNSNLYSHWKLLLEQMDISYQAFLYALSDNKNPVDMNLAFLVELAEPFVELIKENTFYCQTLTPGERGTTLKMCIDSLITHFGTDIFEKELSNDYSNFLDTAVGSRVRVMHIKKNQKKYWTGKDCVRYSMKFSLLYRRILLELLGIQYSTYDDTLKNATETIDRW